MGYFRFSDFWSGASNDINRKLGPVIKLYKRNTKASNKFDDDFMLRSCDIIVIFQFMASYEQSGSRIPDAWSVLLTFSLTVTFHLTKTENKL